MASIPQSVRSWSDGEKSPAHGTAARSSGATPQSHNATTAWRHSSNCHATVAARWTKFNQNRAPLGFCVLGFLHACFHLPGRLLCSLSSFAAARCDARVPTETVELGDVRLAYQSIGRDSDPALLLVMGLGGQLIHWPDEVVSALCEQGFRVIRYDNRDVGLSAWNVPVPSSRLTYEVVRYRLGLPVSAPYTLTDMAGDALHLLDALDIPQAHVLGASMGG